MSGNHGEDALVPLLPDLVDVGVADPGILDVDHHVVVMTGSSGDGMWDDGSIGLEGGEALALGRLGEVHGCLLSDRRLL